MGRGVGSGMWAVGRGVESGSACVVWVSVCGVPGMGRGMWAVGLRV